MPATIKHTTSKNLADRTVAKSNLSKSEKKYRALFENMLDGFAYCRMIFDKQNNPVDFEYLEINDAFERLTGLKRDAIVGKRVTEAIPGIEKANPDLFEIYGRVALTCRAEKFEIFFKPLNKWFSISAYCPQKGYFAVVFEDISERKKTEHELWAAKNDWELTFGSFPDFIAILDNQYKIVRANQAMARQLGVTPEKAIGLVCYECVHGLDYPPDFCPHAQTLKDGKEHTAEVHESRLGGDFLVSTTPIRDAKGNLIGSVHVARNITERNKVEEALRKQASLIDLSPDAIIEKKLDDTITFWSQGAQSLYGWTKEEAVGQKSRFLLQTKFPEQFQEIIHQLEHSGCWSGEKIQQTKSGRKVVVESHWLAATNAQGKIEEILETNLDITERKQLQSKLEEYAKNLEKTIEERTRQLKDAERLAAIGATAGMVGHDIRNPLQAITSDVYLLKTEFASMPEGEEKNLVGESLDGIEKNIDYINKIVMDLQDFSKTLHPHAEEADLKLIIDELIENIGLPENVKLSVKVESDAKKIVTDSSYINRIMYNLLNNAVQAMPKGGKLTIRVHKKGNDVIITVADTGVGIPEPVKSKMFTPMFTTKSKGQGFGLPVVKRMVEALGGTVVFESQEGKGTAFIVSLPLSKC